jgi:nucleoid-associated protein YgaU
MSMAVWGFDRAPHWRELARQAEFFASHSILGPQAPSSSPSQASAASRPGASSVAPPDLRAAPSGPHIDVAEASPKGEVVIAGRAEPGAKVALLDSGEILVETATDPTTGEFVFLPPPLGAGTHRLSLRSTPSSHAGPSQESFVMTLSVAPQGKAALAAKPPPAAPAVSQTEAPSSSRDASKSAAMIVRGDTLWRISRERLGHGALYPTVYQANSTKIRDPDLIYPGQVFMIP